MKKKLLNCLENRWKMNQNKVKNDEIVRKNEFFKLFQQFSEAI